jgi:nucleotide-binding universal stress UspA family protein
MYPFKKVLICLDNTNLDSTLVAFANFIAESSDVEEITLMNIVKSLRMPDEILAEFPDIADKAIDERENSIRQKVEPLLSDTLQAKVKFVVKEGKIAAKILKHCDKHSVDLIIIGRRENPTNLSGALAQRLARRAHCSLLIIPEGCQPEVKKILVPVDFSEHSILAVEEAILIAKNYDFSPEIICQNVYTVPTGYHYTGKTYEEFAQIMERNAREEYQKFISDIATEQANIQDVYSLDENEDPVEDIYLKAKEVDASVIVIGAKGRSSATAFFIGTIAERLVQMDSEFPLLVVRPKGRNAGFLDFIKEL